MPPPEQRFSGTNVEGTVRTDDAPTYPKIHSEPDKNLMQCIHLSKTPTLNSAFRSLFLAGRLSLKYPMNGGINVATGLSSEFRISVGRCYYR